MQKQGLSTGMLATLAVAAGASVANLYYNQPLLADIGSDLHAASGAVGYISTCTQLGYAAGLLLFVPLGDIRERRSLITTLLAFVSLSLAAAALSPNLPWLYAASFAIGLTTVVPQVLVPLAAELAEPERRGKTVGTVMSGLLLGILLARTVSGLIGGAFGWRAMYIVAAALMLLLLAVLRMKLPSVPGHSSATYGQLLQSLATLARKYPTLRESALIGGLNFACFSLFWTTLTFYVEGAPYHYSAEGAGLFGLIGAAGALAAPLAGRLADRWPPSRLIGVMTAMILVSFGVFGGFGHALAGLVVGIVVLDLGVQSAQVANQSRIYALEPAARSRLNTVFMVSSFAGGAIGSSLGGWMWHIGGWPAVSLSGAAIAALSLSVWCLYRYKSRSRYPSSAAIGSDGTAV